MYELSLFTGAGGGLLGTHLLGWTPIGYVEWNDYCQRVIAARIRDGILPNAPIFGNIKTFISSGYAASYTGLVDVVTGGFPCQPFSSAGRQLGADDPRNMWPSTIECIRIIRPRFCLLENVANLVTYEYFGAILGDLAESGYGVRWRVLSAAEVGAPHKRDRLWIIANTGCINGFVPVEGELSNIFKNDKQQWPTSVGRKNRQKSGVARIGNERVDSTWWRDEPRIPRVVDGIPDRLDRLKAVGNGQVPAVVRAAWELLTGGLI